MSYSFKITSSLEKIFFEKPDAIPELKTATMLKNEIYSFQLAAYFENPQEIHQYVTIEVNSPLKDSIKIYREDYVAATTPRPVGFFDDDYLFTTPTVAPDPLFELKDGNGEIFNGQTRAFWFSVEPNCNHVGKFPVEIVIRKTDSDVIGTVTLELEIQDVELPKQEFIDSNWFHGDCIASLHNTEVFSDKYWELTDKYMQTFRKFGLTMILTPVLTPPLDTKIGGERPTNQLVDVYLDKGNYSFGFEKLEKWIKLSKKNDINYFEISHLFTQWGAKYTPKVMAYVDGEYKKIFGWEVESLSDEYKAFLKAFLPALVSKLKEYGVYENCKFHISDEPMPEHKEQYLAAKELVTEFISEDMLQDALADYGFYKEGIVKHPVVSNDHINKFIDEGATGLWTYYCVCQGNKVSNRFIAMPSYRNRVLGLQMYKNNIEGFLQWGFNFWYSKLSTRVIDPYMTNDSSGFASGDPFVVYPVDENGDVVCSLRLYVYNEALQDLRALKLLESLTNNEYVCSFLEDIYRFTDYPRNNEYYLTLRDKINREIASHM